MMTEVPPIFVISLSGSHRREAMAQQLARWPGAWSFVDAVYGRDLTDADLARCYDEATVIRRIGRPMTKGEIGTALSHASVYRRIVEEGIPCALVLEDDAVLEDAFFRFPHGEVDWPFDVLSFFTDLSMIRVTPEQQLAGVTFHRPVYRASSSVAYLVSREGAQRLLSGGPEVRSVADWPVRVAEIDFFVAQPFLIGHRHESSILQDDRAALMARYPKRGRLPRWVAKYLNFPVTALFIRYVVNHDRYDGIRHYFHKEIRPWVLKRFPKKYRVLRRMAAKSEEVREER